MQHYLASGRVFRTVSGSDLRDLRPPNATEQQYCSRSPNSAARCKLMDMGSLFRSDRRGGPPQGRFRPASLFLNSGARVAITSRLRYSPSRMKFLYRAAREVILGIVVGALSALLLRVLTAGLYRLSSLDSFPRAVGTATIVIPLLTAMAGLLLLVAPRVWSFCLKLCRSWSAGILTGILPTWLVLTLLFFWSRPHGLGRLLLFVVIGFVPIVLGRILARRRSNRISDTCVNVPQVALDEVDEFGSDLGTAFDLPIYRWSEDRLNRGSLIKSVAELILRDKAPVVAIVGPFGEGKTSALNLLAASLEPRRDTLVVRFSSWLPGDETTLAVSLFATIADRVRSRYVVFGLNRDLKRFARLLAGAVPRFGEGLKQLFEEPSQTAQVTSLRQSLSELPIRVVVLVDELDRMDRAELQVLLKAIRGVVDLPNLSYACAFDSASLVRLISPDVQYGQSYLEKFFPVQRSLPRIDQEVLGALFDAKLEHVCQTYNLLQDEKEKKKFSDAVLSVWHSSIKRILTNLRKISIFFNALRDALAPVSAEVNLFDMVVLQLVRLVSEDTYQFIYDNGPLFYYPGWRVTLWLERLSIDDEAESRIHRERLSAFFQSIPDPALTRVKTLLEEIFPTVRQYVRNDRISFRGVREEQAEAEKRIYHPDFFPRYFIHQVPLSIFGIAEMSEFIEALNAEQSVSQNVAKFRSTVDGMAKNSWKRWSFLDALIKQVERLGDSQAEAVAMGVAAISDSLEPEVLGLGEWGRARVLVLVAAKHVSGGRGVERILSSSIQQATSDGFAADILRFSTTMRDRNKIITDWTNVNESALKTAFAERMSAKYAVGSDRPFSCGRMEDVSAFHLWAAIGQDGRSSVNRFLRDRFERYPDERGSFLGCVIPRRAVYDGDPLVLVDRLFPTEELFESISERPVEGRSDSDRESVDWFLELMRARRGHGFDPGEDAVNS